MRARTIGFGLASLLALSGWSATASAATSSEIILARPLVPTDISRQHTVFYPNAPAMTTAPGPGPSEARARQMLNAYLLAEFPSDSAARNASRAVYDSAAAKQKVSSPSARAALAALKGTIGEPAIKHIETAKTSGGQPKVTAVVYSNLSPNVYGQEVNTGSGQNEIRLNDDFTADNPFLFTSVLAHESLHQDAESGSSYEEAAANSLDSLIYLRQLGRHPELARTGTGLSRFLNTVATLRLNSGLGSQLGLFATNANRQGLPGSAKDYRSFWDAYDPPVLTNTTGNSVLRAYLHNIGSTCSGATFSRVTLDCIDAAGNAGITSSELVKAAKALKLDTNIERDRALSISYKSSAFKGTLSSPQKPCTRSQTVSIYRQKSGADSKVGADTTDSSGTYSVKDRNAAGKFYAKASRSTVAGTGVCLEAKSKAKRVG